MCCVCLTDARMHACAQINRVARASVMSGIQAEEAAAAAALQLEAPGGDMGVLLGWDPTVIREFRAGVMEVEGGGKRLRPRADKGVLSLESSESDGFMHLIWRRREPVSASSSASVHTDLDLLLLPDDTKVERVLEFNGHAVSGARIYSISYSDGDVYYFWMQEPSIEPDDVLFNRIQV
jgi:hypothetical protein